MVFGIIIIPSGIATADRLIAIVVIDGRDIRRVIAASSLLHDLIAVPNIVFVGGVAADVGAQVDPMAEAVVFEGDRVVPLGDGMQSPDGIPSVVGSHGKPRGGVSYFRQSITVGFISKGRGDTAIAGFPSHFATRGQVPFPQIEFD